MTRSKEKKGIFIAIIAAAVLTAVAAMSVRINEIRVVGNNRYTEQEITELLFSGRLDRNTAYCFFRDKFQEHRQIPFIEDYKIVFRGPFQVEVIVYEKSIVGYITQMGSSLYFDKDGMIVESSGQKLEGVPKISGLEFGHVVLHQPLPVENEKIFGDIMELTQLLATHSISVDEINYNTRQESTLKLGGLDVYLGDSRQMSGKIAELSDMLPVLVERSGTLYLDTYDESGRTTNYRFLEKR